MKILHESPKTCALNSRRKFANASLFSCIFAPLCLQNLQPTSTVLHKYYTKLAQILQKYCTNPALTAVENLQPTNTTTPLPCITICQILAKLHQHERKRGCLALFGYIQMYWSSCCQCIRKAVDLFTYQIVHHTHTVNKLKTYAKQAIELFPQTDWPKCPQTWPYFCWQIFLLLVLFTEDCCRKVALSNVTNCLKPNVSNWRLPNMIIHQVVSGEEGRDVLESRKTSLTSQFPNFANGTFIFRHPRLFTMMITWISEQRHFLCKNHFRAGSSILGLFWVHLGKF